LILGFIANIGMMGKNIVNLLGFEKNNTGQKLDSYTKKLIKFFDALADMNVRLAHELTIRRVRNYKE